MSRSVRLVLLALTLFLALFPLAAGRPGQPATLKADEPAYMLMALSLAQDGDLLAEVEDVQRAFDAYQYLPLNNLILMTPDNWQTVLFGKPYIYSLFAAPFAALLGVNGFQTFNMLLLMAMVCMGASYLRQFNSDVVSALFAAGFFLLSPAFAYVFWIHPEIFNMFSVAACLYLAFYQPDISTHSGTLGQWIHRWFADPRFRPGWSAAALALGVYNKPMLALLGLPALWIAFRRRGFKGAVTWTGGAIVAMAMIAGLSMALTGQATAYLGVDRGGLKVLNPQSFTESIEQLRGRTDAHPDAAANSWQWIISLPEIDLAVLREEGFYFLLGRHTGLVPYMPFAALALLLFVLHSRGSPERWLTLGMLVAVALTFLVWIPFNWHGGGGFIGNRYFVNAYPAFLFLVTAIRPVWLTLAGTAFAAVQLGSILFTPWGAPVPNPTMQAHVRGGLFRYFPFEVSLRQRIPGYDSFGFRGISFMGREDVFAVADEPNGVIWTRGATTTEVWLISDKPLPKLIFDVATWLPDNEIVLEVDGIEQRLVFEGATGSDSLRRVEFVPSEPTRARLLKQQSPEYAYRMTVSSKSGQHEPGNMMMAGVKPLFYIGAELRFVGTGEAWRIAEENQIAWEECPIPAQMEAGAESIEIPVTVRNLSRTTWGMRGALQVNLVYRWLNEAGERLEAPRGQETLFKNVSPGEDISKYMHVNTPDSPGRYRLVFDAIRRHGTLFSAHDGATCSAGVDIVPPSADADAAARRE